MSVLRRSAISVLAIAALLVPVLAAQATDISFSNDFFERTWERTDRPVDEGQVDRTWMWGPGPNTGQLWEDYLESPDGQREVQYFDKSRMERNLTGEPEDSVWYVTNGLLVVEMVTGEIQVGEDSFEPHEADTNNIAGDRAGTTGPTYAALEGLLPAVEDRGQEAITQIADQNGDVTEDPGLADQDVHTAYYDAVTGHNIAGPFWEFMTSSGLVYQDGAFVQGSLFLNPFYATGRPITEPYWTHVPVDGVEQWVLFQAFERRVLTFTPGNEEGWQVEAGNVGRHYFEWRYGYPVDHEPPPGNGDDGNGNGNGGPPPGNGDDGNGGTPPGNGDDDNGNGGTPPGNGDDDNGNGGPPGNGDDGNGNGDGDNGDGNGDNGDTPPDSLGLGASAQVDLAGTPLLNVTAQLNNPSDWSGPVNVELVCNGQVRDSGIVNLTAQGNANVGLNYQSDGILNLELCTVNALIGDQIVATQTVAVASLLPNLPLSPDLNLNVDADISNVVSGLFSTCDATVTVDVQLTNNNDYVGPAQVSVSGLGVNHTQTVQINGPGTIQVDIPAEQGIGLGNLISAQVYNVTVTADGQTVASGTAATAGLNLGSLLCLL